MEEGAIFSRRRASITEKTDIARVGGGRILRLRLIGTMAAWTEQERSVLPAGRKTRALLAVLAMAAPRPMPRGKLAEMLWSHRPEEMARASLRQELHRLHEVLAPAGGTVLAVGREQIGLVADKVWIDVVQVMRASTEHPAALALFDGDLLEGLDGVDAGFDAWLITERERVRDRARAVAEALLRMQAEPEQVIPAAQRVLSIDRTHEGAWRALMAAYAVRGERGMAIEAYDRCRTSLSDLLDATPSPETERLASTIRSDRPSGAVTRAQLPAARPARAGTRVGVLPLRPADGAAAPSEQAQTPEAQLGMGLAEEITAALLRSRWLTLISSDALARFSQTSRDPGAIGRGFGIDLLLDGTIQHQAGRVRISLRLLDLREGNQLVWARRFDLPDDDLFGVQEEIAAQVAAQIDPEIMMIEARRAQEDADADGSGRGLMLRAIAILYRLDRAPFLHTGELLGHAVAREPDHAGAHAAFAYWHVFLVGQGWTEAPAEAITRAVELAERAVRLDGRDARVLAIAGHVRAFLHHRLPEAMALHERALAANPNLAMAWALSAITCLYLGDIAEADRRLARYKQLCPFHPHAFFYDVGIVIAALLKGDFVAAVAAGRAASELHAGFAAVCKPYLAALGHLAEAGDAAAADEAARVGARLRAIEPGFSAARFLAGTAFSRAEHVALYARGLRAAGIGEPAA